LRLICAGRWPNSANIRRNREPIVCASFCRSGRALRGIGFEDLNITGLVRVMLAKDVSDAAWAQLVFCLGCRAAKAGGIMVRVDPRGTAQTCPDCGAIRP
jgi:transposase